MKKILGIGAIIVFIMIYIFFNFNKETSGKLVIQSFTFVEVAPSQNEQEKKTMRISNAVNVVYDDGTTNTFPLTYKAMLHSGESIQNIQFGTMTDKDGEDIIGVDGSSWISNNPDSNSILHVAGKNYLITHFEERPGQLYKTELLIKDDNIVPVFTEAIDFKEIGGTIINCAGSKTTWNTHIGGEEDYSLNTRYADKASPFYVECDKDNKNIFSGNTIAGVTDNFCSYVSSMQMYLKDYAIVSDGYIGDLFTPYNYGYIIEVKVNDDGSTEVAKHYVTGKYTPELAINMPDKKTFYMSDDGSAKGLYKFVSDKPITEFSKNWEGSLYSAKFKQVSSQNAGNFGVEWIRLGHASDNEVKELIAKKLKLSDIFYIKKDKNGTCESDYTRVYEDEEIECLKLKTASQRSSIFHDDDEVKTAAAFLETRKYSGYLGATNEFNKEEGLTYDKDKNKIYMAVSQIEKSMEDNYKQEEPLNDIKLPKNICGSVYELSLDENYSAVAMQSLVLGIPLRKNEKYSDEYYCHPDSISNPDNIIYLGSNMLLIGEDTTLHVNNYVWLYNTQTKQMTRIASLPIGAEVTGLAYSNINTKDPIFINIQHPFTDNPYNTQGLKPNSYLLQNASFDEMKGSIGYIDGLPSSLF